MDRTSVAPIEETDGRTHERQRNRRYWRIARGLAVIICAWGVATPLAAQQVPSRLSGFLERNIGLSSAQIRDVAAGKTLAKALPTPIGRDVAIFGIVSIDVTRSYYIHRVLNVASWLRAPTRPRFGVFSDPVRSADVRDVTIDPGEVRDLKRCQPGHCDFKLPASEMRRIRQVIDSAADPVAGVDAYARKRMLAYVTDYRAHGDSAMVEYDDRGAVHASDAFSSLLSESPYVYQYVAPFHDYLAEYPHARLDGVKGAIYWSEDALPGLKPILSITHLSVYAPPERPGTTVVARKQIYADHYFEAVFDLTLVVDRQATPNASGIFLVMIRRYRFDHLSGGLFNIRGRVIGKLREMMRNDLQHDREASEAGARSADKAPIR